MREVIAAAVEGVADEERDPDPRLLPPWLAAAVAASAAGSSAPLPVHLFTPSVIMLVSHHALFAAMRTTLTQLLRLSMTPALPLPLERYIEHCVLDVPLPPRGLASVGFTLGDRHIVVARPPPTELPTQDVSLRLLFQCLDLQNLLAVFTVMLCEARFALCSVHPHLLTPVAAALSSLLFPFRWIVNVRVSEGGGARKVVNSSDSLAVHPCAAPGYGRRHGVARHLHHRLPELRRGRAGE